MLYRQKRETIRQPPQPSTTPPCAAGSQQNQKGNFMNNLTGLWTIGIKVVDLESELNFHRAIGNEIVLDEELTVDGQSYRIPLIKMGDKYLHLAEKMVYENKLDKPLPYGMTHLVFLSEDFDADVKRFETAGCQHVFEPTEVSAGFGKRKVAFFHTPGGWVCEIAKIYRHDVPEVV